MLYATWPGHALLPMGSWDMLYNSIHIQQISTQDAREDDTRGSFHSEEARC